MAAGTTVTWRTAMVITGAVALGAACTFDLADVLPPDEGSPFDAGGPFTSSGNPPPSSGGPSSSGAPPPPPVIPPPFDSGIVRFGGPCTCGNPDPGGGECPGTPAGCGWDLTCVYYAGMNGRGACVGPPCCEDTEACDADAAAMQPCDQGSCKAGHTTVTVECIGACSQKQNQCGFESSFCAPCVFGNATVEQTVCVRAKSCTELDASSINTACPRATGLDYRCR